MIAAASGDIDMVELMLINSKLDINRQDSFGVNAFWIACLNGHIGIIKMLA
jgi:ankyrin repeat protein